MFSHYDLPLYAEKALRAGASGFLTKAQSAVEILSAVRLVLSGEIYVNHGIARHLVLQLIQAPAPTAPPAVEKLTERELNVVQMLGTGSRTGEIAAALGVTYNTIEAHRQKIQHKLGLQGANQLIHFATEWAHLQTKSSLSTTKKISATL